MQIKWAHGDLQRQIAPRGTDLLLTGRFQVRVLAREPAIELLTCGFCSYGTVQRVHWPAQVVLACVGHCVLAMAVIKAVRRFARTGMLDGLLLRRGISTQEDGGSLCAGHIAAIELPR